MGSQGSVERQRVVTDRHLRRSPTRFRWGDGVGNLSEQNWGSSDARHHDRHARPPRRVEQVLDGLVDSVNDSVGQGDGALQPLGCVPAQR